MSETYEIRLIVNRNDDLYIASWTEPGGQESEDFSLTLPLTPDDMDELRWYLETYQQFPGAGDHARARNIEAKFDKWGRDLFDALFPAREGTNAYRNMMDAADGGKTCLLTIGATDPNILGQPWEMVRDKRGPLAFQGVTIRRQLRGSDRPRRYDFSLPLRVLLIVSRPSGVGFIDPRNSIAPMFDALDALPAGQVEVDFCDPPTMTQLEKTISQARKARRPYQIVHFDGHGTYMPLTGVGALAFESDDGATHLVTGPELGDLLARLNVPLVLLEACRSSDLSDKPVFGSVAPALLRSGVGSVIAFSHSVHIRAAQLLVERLYSELADGMTIGQALEEARACLHADRARWLHRGPDAETIDLQDWFIPQLYQIGDDPILITPGVESKHRTRLNLSIEMQSEKFDDETQRLLKYRLAGFLEISPDAVEITAAERGSVRITVELPAQSGQKLLNAYRESDQGLAEHLSPLVLLDVSEEEKPGPIFHNFPPPPMYRFHGRAMELLEMERAFRRYPALLLSGMGGMGKTALAREAAHWWLRTGRFEAAVFCSFEQRAGAERAVQLLGQAFEGEEFSARSAEEQRKAAVDLFHRRRVLLVWDNFESTLPIYQRGERADGSVPPFRKGGLGGISDDHGNSQATSESALSFGPEARARLLELYNDLKEGSPAGRLLVTCRPAETGLPGIKEMELKGLARPDSLHLLSAILDLKGISTDRPGCEREEIDSLLNAINDHPLSIELIAPHLKTSTPAQIRTEFRESLDRFVREDATEERNRSLLASLEFSKKRLSEAAQEVLPYLAWFEGGVFEQFLLDFAELDPEAWSSIRAELVATALVSVEELAQFKTPYLRFHPTLPYAASPNDVPDPEAAEGRFIAVYLNVMSAADDALRGGQPAAGMALMAREEANFRAAMDSAFQRGDRHEGWSMAETLGVYLQMAGRLRERDALVEWVRGQLPEGEMLDAATCAAILQHAWSRFSQGHADEAIGMVQNLISRLETEGLGSDEDPTYQIALGYTYLERIYVGAHRPDLALEPAQKAIRLFEQLSGDAGRGNLAAALGDLANAYSGLGQFDAALEAAERGLAIDRDLGHDREIATALTQIAGILREQQRYAEADARYTEALRAAQAAGDLGLQGTALQHQGSLQRRMGNHDRAVELYKQAIALFQRAANLGEEMRTCDLLATAEQHRDHLDAAEAWYARARELAKQLNDRAQLAAVAQNVGILYQTRAEGAADPDARAALLRQAVASVEESLAIKLEMQNQVGAASSYGQLGVLHRMSGELDRAEENTQQALKIHESLNLPDVYKDYGNLAEIARARGDADAAARWQAKRDAKLAELRRLRRGEGAGGQAAGLPEQLVKAILGLAQAAFIARASESPLPPDAAEMLAQLSQLPPPFGAISPFLQAIAAGQPAPPLPAGLPPEVVEILTALVEAMGQ
jgi:tetratricopeptide (TPR) repeat protein